VSLPLDGVRIIDLTVVWAGPYATMFLADLGAEVIRVENPWVFPSSTRGYMARPTHGEARSMGAAGTGYPDHDPGDRPWNRHMLFTSHGRNKLSMTLDIRRPSGRELLLRLAERSDLLMENNPAGFLEKFGVEWEVLSARNPRLSVLRMPPAGLSGPYRRYTGFGANFEALCSVTSLRGYVGSDPASRNITAYMDAASGAAAGFAALLALRVQRQTGRGELIELAQTENLLQAIGEYLIEVGSGASSPGPLGNRDRWHAPQGAYPCAGGDDHWVVISVADDTQWQALCRAMDDPDWCKAERFATANGRYACHDELDELLGTWTVTLDRYEAFHRCQKAGVPAAPVLNEADAFEDPHLQARGYFRELTSPDTGTHLYPGHSFVFDGQPLAWGRPSPALGGDNDYVYREVLGLDDDEYAAVVADGHISLDYLDAEGNPL
jgi:crotonobetainyl-CoA:carnitine CoA-transferase CaiB-like acyl-CoA transferase